MNHPYAICHGLIPPEDRLDSVGWTQYRERAAKWQTDLQMYTHIEKGRGGISRETTELLAEAADSISWADDHIERCLSARLEPDEFLETELMIAELREDAFVDSWKKYFQRKAEQGIHYDLRASADGFFAQGMKQMGGTFERLADEEDQLRSQLMAALSY